jgi:hypothetical protein
VASRPEIHRQFWSKSRLNAGEVRSLSPLIGEPVSVVAGRAWKSTVPRFAATGL